MKTIVMNLANVSLCHFVKPGHKLHIVNSAAKPDNVYYLLHWPKQRGSAARNEVKGRLLPFRKNG